MPAVVSRASEHTNDTALEVYCDADDVRLLLKGVEPDDAATELSAWLSATNVDAAITGYCEDAKLEFDRVVGRDFELHEDVDVVVDGNGHSVLRLGELGFAPLLDVSALAVSEQVEDVDDYLWYEDGRVTAAEQYNADYVRPHLYNVFPFGRQNVALTITWGYETLPRDVVRGAAYLAAAQALAHIARSDTQSPGMVGGIQVVQYEDFQVRHFQRSRFSASIETMERKGRQIASYYAGAHAVSLRPDTAGSSLAARREMLGRGRTDLG